MYGINKKFVQQMQEQIVTQKKDQLTWTKWAEA